MTEQPDPADVELIAKAIRDWRYIPDAGDGYPAVRMGSPEDLAQISLTALAAAGRLVPRGATSNELAQGSGG